MSNHAPPEEDELYQRLLPIYREHAVITTSDPTLLGLYGAFSKYWDRGRGSYSAGEAMQRALREAGIIPEDTSSMQDAAQEYEDAMAGMEIMKNAYSEGNMMHFSREALKGIFEALLFHDKILLEKTLVRKNVKFNIMGKVHDDDLPLVEETMIELGYIVPFHKAVTEDGAEEYEHIMQLQELQLQELMKR